MYSFIFPACKKFRLHLLPMCNFRDHFQSQKNTSQNPSCHHRGHTASAKKQKTNKQRTKKQFGWSKLPYWSICVYLTASIVAKVQPSKNSLLSLWSYDEIKFILTFQVHKFRLSVYFNVLFVQEVEELILNVSLIYTKMLWYELTQYSVTIMGTLSN